MPIVATHNTVKATKTPVEETAQDHLRQGNHHAAHDAAQKNTRNARHKGQVVINPVKNNILLGPFQIGINKLCPGSIRGSTSTPISHPRKTIHRNGRFSRLAGLPATQHVTRRPRAGASRPSALRRSSVMPGLILVPRTESHKSPHGQRSR